MTPSDHSDASDTAPGTSVTRVGTWAVAETPAGATAVSRRCRHQLADLSEGHVGADGCLVCPWHASRYSLETGEMTVGPQGAFGYHKRIPGYTPLIKGLGKVAKLRVRPARRVNGTLTVDE